MIDAVLAGEGDSRRGGQGPRPGRGQRRQRADGRVDEAIAANPEVAAKIRDGKIAAAGVLVGAVMKATRGQADAARVRELILQRLSS